MHITYTSARANGAGPGSSPGKSRFKPYRLYPVGIGLTLKRLQSQPSPQLLRISYGQVQGSGYNIRTGNNVSICPEGAKRPNSDKKVYLVSVPDTVRKLN